MTPTPSPRILVADDDEPITWLWERLLRWGLGAEVVTVRDGSSAVARIDTERFDLVITDLRMPGATGLDVLRHAAGREPRVPVIVATADEDDAALSDAKRLGVRAIVRKPFGLDEAVAIARRALSTSNRQPTLRRSGPNGSRVDV